MENREEFLKKVKQFIDRAGNLEPDDVDERDEKKGKERLDMIVNCAPNGATQIINEIRAYEQKSDIESRKLYNFCLKGDITASTATFTKHSASGTSEQRNMVYIYCDNNDGEIENENNRYLDSDELVKLYHFVKEHKQDKTFGSAVFEIMNKHKLEPPQVYKEAMLSRQDFSRVIGPKCKNVKKTTVWSLIIGLHCSMDEANYLLYSAGISKRVTVFDLILEYMVTTKNYDIMAINEVLYAYNQPLLSCHKDVNDKDSF